MAHTNEFPNLLSIPETADADRFREGLDALVKFGAEESIELRGYENASLEKFNRLPEENRGPLTNALVEYVATLQSMKDQQESVARNLNSVWLQLRKLGLRCPTEFFQELQSDDIVEIYTLGGLQIFRSFHFFQYCTYDLETVLCTPWYELFERDKEMDDYYMGAFGRLLTGKVKGMEPIDLPPHPVTEKIGRRRTTLLTPRFFCMLNDSQGKPRAWSHVLRAQNIDS